MYKAIFLFLTISLASLLFSANGNSKSDKNSNPFASFSKEELDWWSAPASQKHIQGGLEDAFSSFTKEELDWWSAPVDKSSFSIRETDDYKDSVFASFTKEELEWWSAPAGSERIEIKVSEKSSVDNNIANK